MGIFPTTLGTRPRMACELRQEGVVAARCEDGAVGVMVAVSRSPLPEGALRPGPRAGNVQDRAAVVGAVRQALEKVFDRVREVTLVVPDTAVRVLLLEFDSFPGKPAEALPIVRFRLKKLLPFDADDAAVSYQVMSTGRGLVRVVAVAMPREVLTEYESVVREAGFEPGSILPSTLAALAGLEESDAPALLVNAGPEAVTTAIVRGGILLLHRSVDMRAESRLDSRPDPQLVPLPAIPAELLANPGRSVGDEGPLALVNRENSVEEWMMQEDADQSGGPGSAASARPMELEPLHLEPLPSGEILQAASVAAAYFEDTLEASPAALLSAGVTSATQLATILQHSPLAGLKIREMVDATMMPTGQGPGAMPGTLPPGWLAGVRGALRS